MKRDLDTIKDEARDAIRVELAENVSPQCVERILDIVESACNEIAEKDLTDCCDHGVHLGLFCHACNASFLKSIEDKNEKG